MANESIMLSCNIGHKYIVLVYFHKQATITIVNHNHTYDADCDIITLKIADPNFVNEFRSTINNYHYNRKGTL